MSAAYDGPSVETWSDRDQRIVVSQPAAGFLYDLTMRAKLVAAPDDVYTVLKDPKSHHIFRGIKDTLDRSTLEDDGKGRRKLRIKHRALTKFLWISVTFDTELFVWEDDNERTIRFTNARSDGFMKKFDGVWHVQPFTQQTLDSIYKKQPQQQESQHQRFHPAAALAGIQRFHHGKVQQQQQTLVTLEQALAPRATPPGPLAHLVRGLCARVLQNMMDDLRLEVHRRHELQEAESADADARRSSISKKLSAASLPVASTTAAHRNLCRRSGGNRDYSSRMPWDRDISSSACQQKSGGILSSLLAAAVPLELSVKL